MLVYWDLDDTMHHFLREMLTSRGLAEPLPDHTMESAEISLGYKRVAGTS